jgi:CheY-like chemotaxis protein
MCVNQKNFVTLNHYIVCMSAKRLLLIDDDQDDHEILIAALNEIDKSIVCQIALNGEEGLHKLDSQAYRPDLIFLDLNMPGMTGFQVLKEIKGSIRLKNIPVVIFSTSTNPKDINETKSMGAFTFITKPSQYNDLRDILRTLLRSIFLTK